jgi:hypothetical protein
MVLADNRNHRVLSFCAAASQDNCGIIHVKTMEVFWAKADIVSQLLRTVSLGLLDVPTT